jgi:hypothetical protein
VRGCADTGQRLRTTTNILDRSAGIVGVLLLRCALTRNVVVEPPACLLGHLLWPVGLSHVYPAMLARFDALAWPHAIAPHEHSRQALT